MLKPLKSKILTFTIEIKLYKTLIKPVLMCGSETWVSTERVIKQLSSKERLRRIYGLVRIEENGGYKTIRGYIIFMELWI